MISGFFFQAPHRWKIPLGHFANRESQLSYFVLVQNLEYKNCTLLWKVPTMFLLFHVLLTWIPKWRMWQDIYHFILVCERLLCGGIRIIKMGWMAWNSWVVKRFLKLFVVLQSDSLTMLKLSIFMFRQRLMEVHAKKNRLAVPIFAIFFAYFFPF